MSFNYTCLCIKTLVSSLGWNHQCHGGHPGTTKQIAVLISKDSPSIRHGHGCGCHKSLGSLTAIFVLVPWDEADTAICHSLPWSGFTFVPPLTFLLNSSLPSGCCSLNLNSELLFFPCLACEPASLQNLQQARFSSLLPQERHLE